MGRTSVRSAQVLVATISALSVVPMHAARALQDYQPSAPGEIVSDASKSKRQFVVGDMLRTRLVTTVEQGPPGILRVGLGQNFRSSPSRDLFFAQLSSAYFEWAVENRPLIIELWDQEGKVGVYQESQFLIGEEYSTPVGCPPGAMTGLCSPAARARLQQPAPAPAQADQPGTPIETVSRHSGFHVSFGFGGGAAGLSCDGCRFSRETATSGYLSLARSIARNTLLGVEATGWAEGGDNPGQVYSLMAQTTGYLNDTSGLFGTAGLGLVGYRENAELGDLRATGFGASGRVGYEIELGRSLLLIPYLAYLSTIGGAGFSLGGEDVGEYDISNLQFGVAIGIN